MPSFDFGAAVLVFNHANIEGADPKALMDHLLNTARDETLDAETERFALEKLSKTIPAWEIERRARHSLPLEKSDRALLYGWAGEQKKAAHKQDQDFFHNRLPHERMGSSAACAAA